MDTATAARRYIAGIRNERKHQYAADAWEAMSRQAPLPEPPAALSVMAAQAVRMRLSAIVRNA